MKKYAVAFINNFDNVIKIEIIEAENKFEAMKKHTSLEDYELDSFNTTYAVEQEILNYGGAYIGCIEI